MERSICSSSLRGVAFTCGTPCAQRGGSVSTSSPPESSHFLELFMRSSTDEIAPEKKSSSGSLAEAAKLWNRKLHYYLGLFTLLFVWLFAFTGLLLNHPWKFAEFWDSRQQSTSEREI